MSTELKIVVTCGENFTVLAVDESSPACENVVSKYCDEHECEDTETVFATDADEANEQTLAAAVQFCADRAQWQECSELLELLIEMRNSDESDSDSDDDCE